MAHYAFSDDNNIVTEVIVGIDETELIEGKTTEEWYGQYRSQKCLRTSYNANIRGIFAGIGFSYNSDEDIFVTPQPHKSWTRFGSYWQAPVVKPTDDGYHVWNEDKQTWDLDLSQNVGLQ